MVKREELEKDPRFRIDDKELDWLFLKLRIYKYSFETLEIGRLRRFVNGKIVSIKETINYKLIMDPTNSDLLEEYQKYCENNDNLLDNPDRSRLVYLKLRDELTNTRYDPKKAVIIVNQYNIIEDGLHRSCILLAQNGEKYKINVLKIKRKHSKKLLILSPLYKITHFFQSEKR